MSIADGLIQELEQEASATRRVLERMPEETLSWGPHLKPMSLGQLALHVAQMPGEVAGIASADLPAPPSLQRAEATSRQEILDATDVCVVAAKNALDGWDDAAMMATSRIMDGESVLVSVPRLGLLRAIMLNHWYRHCGQLLVYLRLLDRSVPSVYGPTVDEPRIFQ